ncbi:uncharacterized protein EI90DRAFT_3120516 [Cantharellus anzutake]|uniref:uncharacterized protein n=1 Tax=Cantharellus anzutake TaxID=1750568 RepID=UPI001906781A|nr:uncharacterized protein EI90DRAFT_3120516 [Cantharellus anzutake]KAF8335424.1 hypothetical protein EI90DRAFT_3120516 [Cantharellus anzutake]
MPMDTQSSMCALGGHPQQTPRIRRQLNPGTSLGRPPKRKLETLSNTPQKRKSPQSPRSPLSDLNNPSSEPHAFSNNSGKLNPPSLSQMVTEATDVSGSKHVAHTSSGLPPIDLSDHGVNTYLPSTPTYILACKTCGSTQQQQYVHAAGSERLRGVNLVMAIMHREGLSLGKFLSVIFDLQSRKDALLPSAHQKVNSFLKGYTDQGTLLEIKHEIILVFEHDFGRDMGCQPTYHPLPPFTSHPHQEAAGGFPASAKGIQATSFYERQDFSGEGSEKSLKQYFAQKVLEEVDQEMTLLASDKILKAGEHTALTWAKVTGFSFTQIQGRVREKAPLLWTILTMSAIGSNVSRLEKACEDAIEGARGCGSKNRRDPWLGCTVSILILAYFRYVKANMLQTVLGNVLFTTSAHWSLHSILGHVGLVTAYSNTLEWLCSLGQDKKAMLKALGCALVAGKIQIHLNKLESGTAATVIVQREVDGLKDAFDGPEYECRKSESSNKSITFKSLKADLKPLHLEGVAIANILRIFLKFIPHLQKFKKDVDNLQYVKYAKCRTKLQKTEYHPLECSGFNEASTQGNRDVVLDAFVRQLGLSRDELEGRQFPVSGDQATVARLRTLLNQTSLCRSWFTAHKWVLPVIELWHLKWAFLKGIFKAHWASKVGKGDVGFRTAAEALGWNINPEKVEFYPCYQLAELVLTTMTLHYASLMPVISIQSRPPLRAPGTPNLTSGVLLPFRHLLLADSQEVIPPPALTPPLVQLRDIPGPTPTLTPSRQVHKTYAPDSGPPLQNPIHISISGTSGLSSDLGL